MACRALALRSLLLPEPLYHMSLRAAASAPAARSPSRRRRRHCHLRCCSTSGAGGDPGQPPQEAVLEAISKVARSKGRVALTTNMVIGGTVTDDSSDEWLVLDQKVNSYPTDRGFTAIGTGGEDFVHSMVDAVESVLQEPVPKGQVTQKLSSRGKYVSVKIGPLRVVSSEQVQAVYRAMRRDNRMRFFGRTDHLTEFNVKKDNLGVKMAKLPWRQGPQATRGTCRHGHRRQALPPRSLAAALACHRAAHGAGRRRG